MEVYITRVNGLSLWNQSQYMQSMVAEIGYELGFRDGYLPLQWRQ